MVPAPMVGRPGPSFTFEDFVAALALDIHFQDRVAMQEVVDDRAG
jgi:hypothetical protein